MTLRAAALVDTHCHLDLYPNPTAVILAADSQQIYTVAVTNTPSVFGYLSALVGEASHVRVALGLHPELAYERQGELPLFRELIGRTRYIGEVGLDYMTSDGEHRRVQREVLTAIVGWCEEAGDKVVTVHSRRAADDVIDVFGAFKGTYILHWYSDSWRSLQRALANGAYVSINPAMLRSERSLSLLRKIPQERVLTETDGPFVSVGGKPAQPHDVTIAVVGLASLWGRDIADTRALIYANFARMLHQKPK